MRFVAISRRTDTHDPARIAALAAAEAATVWTLYSEGAVSAFHFDADRPDPRGILFVEAPDRAAAEAVLTRLPMVAEGLIGFDLHALGPYRGLRAAFDAR
jgi:hypothetical protein